jgi:hypothetical protein
MRPLIFLLLMALVVTPARAADEPAPPSIPPAPSLHGLTVPQREAATAAYEKMVHSWFDGLPPAQQAALEKADEDDHLAKGCNWK